MGFNSALNVPIVFPCSTATGNGLTVNVGTVITPEINLSGSGIDALGTTADLSAPGAEEWTTLISVTGKKQLALRGHASGTYPVKLAVDPSEDTGDGFRFQIVVDGVVAWDQTLVDHASGATQYLYGLNLIALVYAECEQSFLVRSVRKGAFVSANSLVLVGPLVVTTLA